MRGHRTLAALAGNPLVFLYSNPDIPVEIAKTNPYISISRTEKGFLLETNIENTEQIDPILVLRESDTKINVIEFTGNQRLILEQLFRFPEYPAEAEPLLKELLSRISGNITIHSDLTEQQQSVVQSEGNYMPVVQILPLGECFKAEVFIKPLGELPPYCKPGIGNRSVMGKQNGQTLQAIRNFRMESEKAEIVYQIFREFDMDSSDVLTLESTIDCLELLDQLHNQEGVVIEWPEEEKIKIRHRASSSGFSMSVKGNNTWFDIDGALRISKNEEIQIVELMKQVRESQSRFIRLEGNGYVALTHELRRQMLELSSILFQQKDSLHMSGFALPLLDSLERSGVEIKKDKAYEDLKARVENAGKLRPVLPSGLQADLREYQEEGYRWMSRLADWGAGACLADDMGLGKTVQAITMLLARGSQGPSLVIVPASVLANWENEINRFAPALTIKNLNTPGQPRASVITESEAFDVVITTYGLLIAEEETLVQKKWNMVILDEAHTIKNRETKMSKAAMKLKAGFRLILTGTPIQNHLSEIWNLFEFINPGLLGSFGSFNERFIMPIELREDKKQQQLLKKMLSPFILRRTKTEVLNELPGKTEILQLVDLSQDELAMYESLRRKAEMSLQQKDLNAVRTLAEITRLRQAACHRSLIYPDYEGSSSKTNVFMELVHELIENNHRALVFSQFTSHLALIKKELDRYGIRYLYLDGSTPTPHRSKLVKDFQTGDQPLFLISLKAGGLGLNLTAADYIIHLDPWWNPAVEDQASDRAYRIGQTRPVTVYRLISRHTIEEKIIRLHHTKKDLADSLLEGSNMAHQLTREEMLELIKSE
ncbi:MAG: DEAD/DEAH box helicase [Bacteroidales bacterium]